MVQRAGDAFVDREGAALVCEGSGLATICTCR